jgi:hypothetical protein
MLLPTLAAAVVVIIVVIVIAALLPPLQLQSRCRQVSCRAATSR